MEKGIVDHHARQGVEPEREWAAAAGLAQEVGTPGLTPERLTYILTNLPWGKDGVPAPLDRLLMPARVRPQLIGRLPPGRLEFLLLAALGISGWSVRQALVEAISRQFQLIKPASYQQAFAHLVEADLWYSRIANIANHRVALVRLSERGADLLREAGIPVVPSEWERCTVKRLSLEGEPIPHTGAICMFLYHARHYGYLTEACPQAEDLDLGYPDALLVRAALRIYVEVQGRVSTAYRMARREQVPQDEPERDWLVDQARSRVSGHKSHVSGDMRPATHDLRLAGGHAAHNPHPGHVPTRSATRLLFALLTRHVLPHQPRHRNRPLSAHFVARSLRPEI